MTKNLCIQIVSYNDETKFLGIKINIGKFCLTDNITVSKNGNKVKKDFYEFPLFLIKEFFSNLNNMLKTRYARVSFFLKHLSCYSNPDIVFDKSPVSDIVVVSSNYSYDTITDIEFTTVIHYAFYVDQLIPVIENFLQKLNELEKHKDYYNAKL